MRQSSRWRRLTLTAGLAAAAILTTISLTAPAASAAGRPGAEPASVGEVARKHPSTAPSDPQGTLIDGDMTLVKYYNNVTGQYEFCVANYHHTGEVSEFFGYVDWTNGPTDTLPLPGPGGLKCSPWRALHGSLHVQYWFLGHFFIDAL